MKKAVLAALWLVAVGAQQVRADDGPPMQCLRIENVRLHPEAPPSAAIEVRGESVAAVETAATAAPERPAGPLGSGCARVDGRGAVATTGLIDPWSTVGLIELGSEHGTHDVDNRHPAQPAETTVRAAVDTALAFNGRSVNLPVTRLEGVTTIVGAPQGGIISGFGFGADLLVGPRATAVFAPRVAQFGALAPRAESRAGILYVMQRTFDEARRWPALKGAFERNATAGWMHDVLDLEALQPVVTGRMPLVIYTHRAADIETALDLFGAMNPPVRLVIAGGGEAWMVRERLAAARVPVIIDPLQFGPGGFDQLHPRPDAAALLEAAGVKVMFGQRDPFMARKQRQLAGNAVREGMSWQGALDAITRTPAEVYGLEGRGRLEKGAAANIVLWNGDPFETTTSVTWLMIRGRIIPLRSRQTELFERYRDVPPTRAVVRPLR
jgi:imidazolonepropionase-like amidohydrolase